MKPILFSLVSLLVSLCFFGMLLGPEPPAKHSLQACTPSPKPVASPQVKVETKPADPNEGFRMVPSNFTHVDFNNRSYGRYKTSSANRININLTNGNYEYSDGDVGESFDLKDVYFTDVTGDESPEAIVLLWHVQCGVSCDGGNALFLVYKTQGSSLKEIWRFETGSYAYGCGLKSLTIMKKHFIVQMFGKCLQPQAGYSGPGKFMVAHTTLSNFRLSGNRFIKRGTDLFFAPVRDVGNYHAQIHIIE